MGPKLHGGKPIIIVCLGLPGVGKTTVSVKMARILGADLISEDNIKLMLARKLLGESRYRWHIKHQIPFPMWLRSRVYREIHTRLTKLLEKTKIVIVDGIYPCRRFRQELLEIAGKFGAHVYVIEIICQENVLKARLMKRRKSGHPAGWGMYMRLKRIWEPINIKHATIDTTSNIDEQIDKVIKEILNVTNLAP